FKLWTESNSPLHIPYLRNALVGEYWSNASNFTRLWSIYQEGGIYMETDVDLLRPLDELLEDACLLGFETSSLEQDDVVNTAVFGAMLGHEFVLYCLQALLSEFHGIEEANQAGPGLAPAICRDSGLVSYGEQCLVRGRVRIYEKEIFYPISFDGPRDTEIPSS